MTFYIKQLTTQDYASVRDIFCLTFLKEDIPVSYLGYRWRNRTRANSFGVYNRGGDLLGFALVSDGRHHQQQQLEKDKKHTETASRYLSFMALHPNFRGGALGSELLKVVLMATVNDNKSLCLFPLEDTRLKAWYKHNGFNLSTHDYFNFHCHRTRNQAKYLAKLQV